MHSLPPPAQPQKRALPLLPPLQHMPCGGAQCGGSYLLLPVAQHVPWRGAQCGGSYLLLPVVLMGGERSPTAAQHMPWRGAL